MEKHDGEAREELLNEAVTDAEVSELIKRLEVDWSQIGTTATVADVAEATGQAPRRVASILAEIRRETFEAEFRQTFGTHGAKIERLEDRTERLEQAIQKPSAVPIESVYDANDDLVMDTRSSSVGTVIFVALLALIGFVVGAGLLIPSRKNESPGRATFPGTEISTPARWSIEQRADDGAILRIDANENMTATLPDGTRRPVTNAEQADLMASWVEANKR